MGRLREWFATALVWTERALQGGVRLLRDAPPALVRFFIYALEKEASDPLEFLGRPVDRARRDALFRRQRNLWCTAVFQAVLPGGPGPDAAFSFDPVDIIVTDDAVVRYASGPAAVRVQRFRVLDPARYADAMTRTP